MVGVGADSAKRAKRRAELLPCGMEGALTWIYWSHCERGLVEEKCSLWSAQGIFPHPKVPTKPTPILHALFHVFTARWHYLGQHGDGNIGGEYWKECCICRKQEVLSWGDPYSPF